MAVLAESDRRPSEGVLLEQPSVTCYIGTRNVGAGTLFICEGILSWIVDENLSLHIPYPNIILHAISRDLTAFRDECLYLHTDFEIPSHLQDPDQSEDSSDEEMDDDNPKVTEVRLVPANKEALTQIFNVIAQCQAMHSDPAEYSDGDEEFEGNEVDDAVQDLAEMNIRQNGTNGHGEHLDEEDDEAPFEDAP